MFNMKKRVISLLLTVVMVLTIMPMTALTSKANEGLTTDVSVDISIVDGGRFLESNQSDETGFEIAVACANPLTPGEECQITFELSNNTGNYVNFWLGDIYISLNSKDGLVIDDYFYSGTFTYPNGDEISDWLFSIESNDKVTLIYTRMIPSDSVLGDYLYIDVDGSDELTSYHYNTKIDIENIPERTGDVTFDIYTKELLDPNLSRTLYIDIYNNSNQRYDIAMDGTGWLTDIVDTNVISVSSGEKYEYQVECIPDDYLSDTDEAAITFSDSNISPITITVSDVYKYLDGRYYYSDNRCLYFRDGIQVKDEWIYDERTGWYYFNETGFAVKGWNYIDGNWYYFASQNLQLQVVEGHSMITGWLALGGVWYYFEDSGAMVTGWQEIGGKWYYFYDSGAMAASTWIGNYYVDSSGAWVDGEAGSGNQTYVAEGWQQSGGKWWYQLADSSYPANEWKFIGGEWYYFDAAGWMATGWVFDGFAWYYMNPSGDMATGWINDAGTWYYMETSGAMKTGWLNDNGTWYYLNNSGAMVTDTVIDGYTIDKNGVWVQ